MGVAQYLGVFLLENELCYLHGIGNLEVKKIPAGYDDVTNKAIPASYDIVFSKTTGSIDDAFANFIATQERVSISNAANQIKLFVEDSLQKMKAGNSVDLPGLGKFYMNQDGVQFEKDAQLHIQGKSIPFFKIRESAERKQTSIEEIYEKTEIKEVKAGEDIVIKPATVNWKRVFIIVVLFLLVVGAIGYFVYQYFANSNQQETTQVEQMEEMGTPAELLPQEERESIEEAVIETTTEGPLKVILNDYTTLERAETRSNQLKGYGHNMEVVELPNGSYGVVMIPEVGSQNDQEVLDSLKLMFGGNPRFL